MSVVDRRGVALDLPRVGGDPFWMRVRLVINRGTRRQRQRHWKYLAMLALRESAGWCVEDIADAFGHPKGHIARCLENIKRELRERWPDAESSMDPAEVE